MIPYLTQPFLELGPLTIHAFGVTVAIAVMLGLSSAERRLRRAGFDPLVGGALGVWVVDCGMPGAHLFSVRLYFPEKGLQDPFILLRVWEDISSFGGTRSSGFRHSVSACDQHEERGRVPVRSRLQWRRRSPLSMRDVRELFGICRTNPARSWRRALVLALAAGACTTPREAPADLRAGVMELSALPPVDVVGTQGREPMIVRTADSALLVTGYGEDAPLLWRSADEGQTWVRVRVGTEADGAVGNSDVDLAVSPDGTLYFVVMSYNRATYEGLGIAVAASRDNGTSWNWTSLSRDRFDDRPWVEVAPDGTAHVIWNDGAGVSHAVSTDRGVTWKERDRIVTRGGSSHLAISDRGVLAVRVTPSSASMNRFDAGVDSLSISADGGVHWTRRGLPGVREWAPFDERKPMLRWVEPVAWDSTGALFSLWSEGSSMWLGRSRDNGVSWMTWRIAQDSVPLYFPYLIARSNGELSATWFSGLDASVQVHVAHIVAGSDVATAPSVARAAPFAIPSFDRTDSLRTLLRDTGGEYAAVMFLSDDRIAVVTTIQQRPERRYGFTFRPFVLLRP